MVRSGKPAQVADQLLHATYRGKVRGQAMELDLLIAFRGGRPSLRLRILRPVVGSSPAVPLRDNALLLAEIEKAWPVYAPPPCADPDSPYVRLH